MKKTVKILTILLVAIILISVVSPVFAAKIEPGSLQPDFSAETTQITNTAGRVMGMIRNIAVVASVIVLMVIGVKFILGSTEEKAEYKKSLVPLVIGIVIVVAATSIAAFLFNTAGA